MNNWPKSLFFWILIAIAILFVVKSIQPAATQDLDFNNFLEYLEQGRIVTANIFDEKVEGEMKEKKDGEFEARVPYRVEIRPEIIESIKTTIVEYNKTAPKPIELNFHKANTWFLTALASFFPFLILIAFIIFFMRQMQMGSNKAMSFGKSRAKLFAESGPKLTFEDVAGADEAKEELQEIIEFLKDPQKFQKLGGKIPKGVLLIGHPGTGKTLLARAVAGEAGVPFFSISGSDFVEMFVGVGASRVRDLFDQGKKNAPCIIFIDEIDAVGRHRFAGIGGGHDEREQTLNALLVEMDGFNTNEGVIIIAATNRPDVLDPALMRAGRFDRQITVDVPDLIGREGIFKVHTKAIVLARVVEVKTLARRTPGFSGADIANCVNEAALLAARRNKDAVDAQDFEDAIDRVMAGPEKKSKVMSEKEKKVIAYHESGHALMHLFLENVDPLHKVSILPRGRALGYTMHVPMDDKYLTGRQEMMSMITSLLGGRVAEQLIFNEITTGAQNDLERCTHIAKKMVCEFGMSEKLGPLSFGHSEQQVFLGRDFSQGRGYSEEIAFEIDKEVRSIVDECYQRCEMLLRKNLEKLHTLAGALLEREVLDKEDVYKLLKMEPKEDPKASHKDKAVHQEEEEDEGWTAEPESGKQEPGLLPPAAPESA